MKIKFNHPEPNENQVAGPKYWKSLDELSNTDAFKHWMHREFPSGASEMEGVNRRHFMKIMAASFALAGLGMSGCRGPRHKILPYSKQPENMVPGVPMYYATSMPGTWDNIPLIIETHDARPTKIEGNPSYKPYGGKSNLAAQASVLDLYDPNRVQESRGANNAQLSKAQVQDVMRSIQTRYQKDGVGLAFLAEPSTSPTRLRLQREVKKLYPNAIWAEYEPVRREGQMVALNQLTGKNLRVRYDFEKAKRVLAIEADFLGRDGVLGDTRGFANARRVANSKEATQMNRLYAIESNLTLTGANADHRLRLHSSEAKAVTYKLAAALYKIAGLNDAVVKNLEARAEGVKVDPQWIQECAADLYANKGSSLIVVSVRADQEMHTLVALMNEAIGANGKTAIYFEPDVESVSTIEDLAQAIERNQVKTLVIFGGNPVYNAPANLGWSKLQRQVPEVIRHGYYDDETSEFANIHIAANHYLESWSDGRTFDGTYVPVQPMIHPIFNGFGELELLADVLGHDEADGYKLVFETFSAFSKAANKKLDFDQWLAIGVLEGSAFPAAEFKYTSDSAHKALRTTEKTQKLEPLSLENMEICFVPSNKLGDGRYANNGWLQELPDPITKLSWDNAFIISPTTAIELEKKTGIAIMPKPNMMNESGNMVRNPNVFEGGKEMAQVIEVTLNGRTLRGPMHVQPGIADYTIIATMGYGRSKSGNVGQGVGFDVYPFITSENPTLATGVKLRVTEETYSLANGQEHWSMEGRDIIREANAEDYEQHPDFATKMGPESHSPNIYGPAKNLPLHLKVNDIPRGQSLYQTPEFKAVQQWGMTVDLNTCTGCNACVIACQSENNIPIVGKDQVLRGREMHWIRIDRYFSSGQDNRCEIPCNPHISFMGVMCQHCELAPCETVCPVNATVHDEQGLNTMAYNRCVGTRYCANNCPWKVRRFNFFDWNKRSIGHFYEGPLGPAGMPELHKMQKNPNVTVRMRGVMEKCTYCVQRIESAKIHQLTVAKNSGNIKVPDGTIVTACQQACPANAIEFGDVADATTKVSQLKDSDRNYSVLGYLNTRPRTTYLAKLRNPNPKMPDFLSMPLSRLEYEKRQGSGKNGHGKESGHENAADANHHAGEVSSNNSIILS